MLAALCIRTPCKQEGPHQLHGLELRASKRVHVLATALEPTPGKQSRTLRLSRDTQKRYDTRTCEQAAQNCTVERPVRSVHTMWPHARCFNNLRILLGRVFLRFRCLVCWQLGLQPSHHLDLSCRSPAHVHSPAVREEDTLKQRRICWCSPVCQGSHET